MMTWSLGKKFSVFLALIALIGSGLAIGMLSQHLNDQAEQAVQARAEILLTTMRAARNYTRDNVQPILESQKELGDDFIRETVPNFAVRQIFADFRQQSPKFQEFLYKEAALNPTNLEDRADEFEEQVLAQLKTQAQTNGDQQLSGYRQLNGRKLFYLASPLIMDNVKCLRCHGSPQEAPQYLLDMYGDQHGFGWELNEIIATQMMYVPASQILEQGQRNLVTVTKTLLSILGAIFVVVNLLLWRTVTQPLQILTGTAKLISQCSLDSAATHLFQSAPVENRKLKTLIQRQDEPGQLARAFDYMVAVLSQREQDLQQAVRARTRSLEQEMRDRQMAQDALQTYSHAMNHDLRNMVMGISNVLQAIVFRHQQQPDSITDRVEVESQALDMIQKSCDRQLNLMNSLMDVQVADVWRIVLRPESVDLYQLIDDLKATYEPKLRLASAILENQIPQTLPPITVDPLQMQRVFENLIGNALKYNSDGILIQISAEFDPENSHQMLCRISDNGVGIAPDQIPDLFEIYTRGDQLAPTSGYGLGLYICRQIIEAHGGTIGIVAPEKSSGAEFWFTLPIR